MLVALLQQTLNRSPAISDDFPKSVFFFSPPVFCVLLLFLFDHEALFSPLPSLFHLFVMSFAPIVVMGRKLSGSAGPVSGRLSPVLVNRTVSVDQAGAVWATLSTLHSKARPPLEFVINRGL